MPSTSHWVVPRALWQPTRDPHNPLGNTPYSFSQLTVHIKVISSRLLSHLVYKNWSKALLKFTFFHAFIHRLLPELLICAGHYPKGWRYRIEHDGLRPFS